MNLLKMLLYSLITTIVNDYINVELVSQIDKDPRYATAQDIILPPCVEINHNTQHIAMLTEPVCFYIGFEIEISHQYLIKSLNIFQDSFIQRGIHETAKYRPISNTLPPQP